MQGVDLIDMTTPIGSALTTLASGLTRERVRLDTAAAAIVMDPTDPAAIVDLQVAGAGVTAMSRAVRVVRDTDRTLIDALA